MDERQIERFIDVVQSKSMSRTAKRLRISQPALSKSLRQLEDRLDARLLQRTPRGVLPTEFGHVFYRRALLISAELRRANEELDNLRGSTEARVAIGVTPGPGLLDKVVPRAVEMVVRARPMLNLTVRSGTISELLPALNRGELDLMFTVLDEQLIGANVSTKVMFEDKFVIVAQSHHPLHSLRSISLKDLLFYRWALLEDARPLWNVIEDAGRQLDIKTRFPPINSTSVLFVRSIVARTDYIGILPSYDASVGPAEGIAALSLDSVEEGVRLPRLTRPMGIVHSRDSELTAGARAVLSAMIGVCEELQLCSVS